MPLFPGCGIGFHIAVEEAESRWKTAVEQELSNQNPKDCPPTQDKTKSSAYSSGFEVNIKLKVLFATMHKTESSGVHLNILSSGRCSSCIHSFIHFSLFLILLVAISGGDERKPSIEMWAASKK